MKPIMRTMAEAVMEICRQGLQAMSPVREMLGDQFIRTYKLVEKALRPETDETGLLEIPAWFRTPAQK